MSEDIIKEIRQHYNGAESPNDSFINDVFCNIVDDGVFSVKGIDLAFCNTNDEQKFWKKYIDNSEYVHLFLYSVLNKWHENVPQSDELRKWIDSFQKEKKVGDNKELREIIIDEMHSFKENPETIKDIPDTIFTQIGFIIDSYLWLNKLEVPVFMRWAKDKNLLTEELYDKYYHLLIDSLKNYQQENINHYINVFIYFCKATDLVIGQGKCFYTIMEMISDHSINSQKAMPFQLRSILERNISIDTLITIINFYYINSDIYNDNNIIDFCTTSEERAFWTNCIEGGRYAHLLTFSILEQWQPMSHWIDYLKDNYKLEKEMRDFLAHMAKDADSIPFSIIIRIGFIIDSFLWEKHKEIPRLFKLSKFPINLANDYKKVLLDEIKENDKIFFNDDQEKVLQYCLTLDLKSINNNVFRDILKLTSRNKSNDLSILLINYPYYGDDFGITLLAFCKKNDKTYRLSSETISTYEYHLCKDSWIEEFKKRLEKEKMPYNPDLCRETPSHGKLLELINLRQHPRYEECLNVSTQVINEIKKEDPYYMTAPVEERIVTKIKNLCEKEKYELTSSKKIKSLLTAAKFEGMHMYFDKTVKDIADKGKKIVITEKVKDEIFKLLIDKYFNKSFVEFTQNTDPEKKYEEYAECVASIWIDVPLFGHDCIRDINDISNTDFEEIRNSFNDNIWNHLIKEVLDWCDVNYSK